MTDSAKRTESQRRKFERAIQPRSPYAIDRSVKPPKASAGQQRWRAEMEDSMVTEAGPRTATPLAGVRWYLTRLDVPARVSIVVAGYSR